MQFVEDMGARADSLSALQNLGKPLMRFDTPASQIPWENPMPAPHVNDTSLDADWTRTKKCCKGPLPVDRISSEFYPIDAKYLKDVRRIQGVFGTPSRYDGRDPIAYFR